VLFGVFIVLTLFQGVGFTRLAQPAKGIAMTAAAIALAVVMQLLYGVAANLIAPALAAGAPGYGLELWLATAMLGVTFPLIVVFCGGVRLLAAGPGAAHRSGTRDRGTERGCQRRRHPADRLPGRAR